MMTAKELNNQTFEAIRTIRQTAQDCGRLVLAHRARQRQITTDGHTSAERKNDLAAAARKDALDELATIGARVAAGKDRVAAALSAARKPSGSTEEQLLDEQRLSRACAHVHRQLDAGASPSVIASDAVTDEDSYIVRALLSELPARLRAAGADADVIAGELELVKQTAGDALPEVARKADTVAADLEQAIYFAQVSLVETRGELEGTSEAVFLPSSKTEGLNLMQMRR